MTAEIALTSLHLLKKCTHPVRGVVQWNVHHGITADTDLEWKSFDIHLKKSVWSTRIDLIVPIWNLQTVHHRSPRGRVYHDSTSADVKRKMFRWVSKHTDRHVCYEHQILGVQLNELRMKLSKKLWLPQVVGVCRKLGTLTSVPSITENLPGGKTW